MFALLCLAACGGDDENIIQDEILEAPLYTSYSFDKKYKASIYTEKIRVYNGSDIIWEKPLERVYTEVDHGYGDIEFIELSINGIFFFPNSYNVYIMYGGTWFYFYDLNGNLLNKVSTNTFSILGQKCPWDKSLCIIQIWPNVDFREGVTYYQTFDENGNNEVYKCVNNTSSYSIPFFDNVEIIANTDSYVTYNEKSIIFMNVNEEKKVVTIYAYFDLGKFIRDNYPEETNSPRYGIAELNIGKDKTVATIDVTFYSGDKEQLEITIDNNTGKLIE